MTNDEHERIVAELIRKYLILSVELEDLRALITAWADADDDPEDVDGPYHAAWLALRKAVGR